MRPGAPGGRLIAAFVDGLIYVGLAVLIGQAHYAPLLGVFLVFFVLYAPLMLAFKHGQTLGKMAGNVRVVKENGEPIGIVRAFLRERVLKLLFGPLASISLLMVAFRKDGRALHDAFAGTSVIEAGPEPAYLREPDPVHPEDSEPWPEPDPT
jgi:uncharacterized RDD family membrane protein YckC